MGVLVEDRQEPPVAVLAEAAGWLQRNALRTETEIALKAEEARRAQVRDPNLEALKDSVGGVRVLLNELLKCIEAKRDLAAAYGLDPHRARACIQIQKSCALHPRRQHVEKRLAQPIAGGPR